jgi:hypothetical protein
MTPKEKAKNLVNKHFDYVEAWSASNQIENAKKCALITVNEILLIDSTKYWNEVKTEIKKITL